MKKMIFFTGFFLIFLGWSQSLSAQNKENAFRPTYRIGIFAPLYLDSVFSNNTFRYKQGVPRFIKPAVDFVQGALIALDSMQLKDENIETVIYDSKSYTKGIPYLIQHKNLDSLHLIIGSVKDEEYKQLSDFALQKNIPFISATYPNDGGITKNPFLVIVNPTLKTHCDAIYRYILQNHGTDHIFLCRQKGKQEDMVATYFKQLNEEDGTPLLNITTINFENDINAAALKSKLDSNQQTIIIGGSLDEKFAYGITTACYNLSKSYPIKLIGMPNWDGAASIFKKNAFPDFPIYFTTPYYNNNWNAYSRMVINAYNKKYKGKPNDMAFKGFEAMYLFTRLLAKHQESFMSQLNDKTARIFCDYNFKPVLLNKENTIPDYFENKHLYFMKILNGTVSRAW